MYTYNLGGSLIEETYPSLRVVKNTFDQDGNLSQVQSRKNSSVGYWTYADSISRDTAGNVTKMQLGNGLWETAIYNDRLQVQQIGLGGTDGTQNLLKLEYKYDTTTTSHDNNGSMREQKITVPAVLSNSSFTATQTYTYDALNRIHSAEETVDSSTTWKQTFTIDRYGNRNFDTSSTGLTTTLGSCPSAECNPAFDTTNNNNRFNAGQGYSYDHNGSITQNAAGERFGYDQENHQNAYFVNSNSGSTPDATYAYDGEGRRVKKVSALETTIFVYDGGGQSIAEYSTQTTTTPHVAYLTQDHLGSPRIITNENGAVNNRKDFMPSGDQVISAQRVGGSTGNNYDPDVQRQDYTGYEKDAESGLEFAQARYYNPTHGRYTSVDPMIESATIKNPQTFNRYSYVLNSPYKLVDPLGLAAVSTGMCGSWCNNSGAGPAAAGGTGEDYWAFGCGDGEPCLADEDVQAHYALQDADGSVDYFINRDGSIQQAPTNNNWVSFFYETNPGSGEYRFLASQELTADGLVHFYDTGDFFDRYGAIDAGGKHNNVNHGSGDHFVKPIVAAALFGMAAELKDSYQITMSFGDMSADNGTDPWQQGVTDHHGHGHDKRSGLDIDFRYVNSSGLSFQGEMTNKQFDVSKNQTIYAVASKFGFTENYQGTQARLKGIKAVGGHNDHGHLGYGR